MIFPPSTMKKITQRRKGTKRQRENKGMIFFFAFCLFFSSTLLSAETLWLREGLEQAHEGDYLVTSCNKTYTLLLIREKRGDSMVLEEISAPQVRLKGKPSSWKEWIAQGAPHHTSWVAYDVHLPSGQMHRCYSFSKNAFFSLPDEKNFFSTLIRIPFEKIPEERRKRTGWSDKNGLVTNGRRLWQPVMIFEGTVVSGITIDAWKTIWPKDNSELSGKTIEVYLPSDRNAYSSYFPYWLQITGTAARAMIRVVDSGKGLASPQPSLPETNS